MAGTKKFISATVGVGGVNRPEDVGAVQQLLIAAGIPVKGGADRAWGKSTLAALQNFLQSQTSAGRKVNDDIRIEPSEDVLLKLAEKANILIPLPRVRGIAGINNVHAWFVKNNIKYQAGAQDGGGNRCVYGVDGKTGYAVQTESKAFREGPVEMDCTTYANLMLSIYLYGNAHNPAYDGDCARVGGVSSFHCARDRYGFQIVSRKDKDRSGKEVTLTDFRTADQIEAATKEKGAGLYALEPAVLGSGSVKHLALLYGSDIYECTNVLSPNCNKHSLGEFMDRCRHSGRFCYLFGPKL
jgi:hypothetical protein